MGPQQLLNPRPAILVGTYIDGKPNFFTVSWAGITSADPRTMSIAVRNIQYSLKGIQENRQFSVNVPTVNMVRQGDYETAASWFERSAAADPTCPICEANLLLVYVHLNRDDLAERHLERLVKLEPLRPDPISPTRIGCIQPAASAKAASRWNVRPACIRIRRSCAIFCLCTTASGTTQYAPPYSEPWTRITIWNSRRRN